MQIACLGWDAVKTTQIQERNRDKYRTLQVDVLRIKTAAIKPGEDEVLHFVHMDDISKCYVFIMFYYLVMNDEDAPDKNKMFPSWYHLTKNNEQETDSKVAHAFSQHWKCLSNIASNYVKNRGTGMYSKDIEDVFDEYNLEELPQNKSVHDGKRVGVQTLGDSGLMPQDIIARSGWLVKNFNTFFDYWVKTKTSMVKTGKVLGGWSYSGADQETSGKPPSMSNIKTNKESVQPFVDSLLGRYTFLSKDVKELLVANGIRFYKAFVELLMKEPGQKYSERYTLHLNHSFVKEVSVVCRF